MKYQALRTCFVNGVYRRSGAVFESDKELHEGFRLIEEARHVSTATVLRPVIAAGTSHLLKSQPAVSAFDASKK